MTLKQRLSFDSNWMNAQFAHMFCGAVVYMAFGVSAVMLLAIVKEGVEVVWGIWEEPQTLTNSLIDVAFWSVGIPLGMLAARILVWRYAR